MAQSTPATQFLLKAGVAFELATYAYDPDAAKIGLQAAEALGEPAHRVLKTLVAEVDGKPVCIVLPSDREASLKKVAAVAGGKSARMAAPADAERITGYKIGGVSPFGQKKRLPVLVEQAALTEPYVFVNGGQRGLQIRLAPADLVTAAGATAAAIVG